MVKKENEARGPLRLWSRTNPGTNRQVHVFILLKFHACLKFYVIKNMNLPILDFDMHAPNFLINMLQDMHVHSKFTCKYLKEDLSNKFK